MSKSPVPYRRFYQEFAVLVMTSDSLGFFFSAQQNGSRDPSASAGTLKWTNSILDVTICVFCSTVDVYADLLHPRCCIFLHRILCQCNRKTVLDYKPWLYAAQTFYICICRTNIPDGDFYAFLIQSSWSTYQIGGAAEAWQREALFGFLHVLYTLCYLLWPRLMIVDI